MRRFTTSLVAIVAAATLGLCGTNLAVAAPQTPIPDYTPAKTGPANKDGIPRNGDGPATSFFPHANFYSIFNPGTNPQGANDFSCTPKPGQLPLILLAGTGEDAYKVWGEWAPKFKALGYCVFTPNLNNADGAESQVFTGDIIGSAEAFATYVQMVLKATGAKKVDVIGHSQGAGMLPLAYIKWFDGNKYMNKLIGLCPGNHGTGGGGYYQTGLGEKVDPLLKKKNMQGWTMQFNGNAFVEQLDANNIDFGDTQYIVVMTKYDEIITPYTSGIITNPKVKHVVMQDICANDYSDHIAFTYNPNAYQVSVNLMKDRPANYQVKCELVVPLIE